MIASRWRALPLTRLWVLMLLGVALGALLLMAQPVGAQSTTPIAKNYMENDTRAVHTVYATDPEGKGLNWSTSGPDGEVLVLGQAGAGTNMFDISDRGVLTFKTPPDFENPTDDGVNNIYNVSVTAADAEGNTSAAQAFVITVTNVEERGMVMLSGLQPRVGVELTADLSDEDVVTGSVDWQWASSSSMGGSYSNIANATNPSYTPVADDEGMYLRATASYMDRESTTITKSAYMASPYPVQAKLALGAVNMLPTFDQDATATDVQMLFDLDTATAGVQIETSENSPVGTNVGPPIAATDPDEDDKLTYSLADTTANSGHSAYFDIDRATGQITVKKKLNFEATDQCGDPNACAVTVTATDSSGVPTTPVTIAVVITVTNVNEPPKFIRGMKAVSLDEGITGTPSTAIDPDGDGTDNSYGVEDPETTDTTTLTWKVSGTDGDNFAITTAGVLTFKGTTGPDYEKPADANRNNVYEITLEVSDGTNTATMDVKVTVKNVQETPGTVTLSHLQPREGRSLTATLMDPDGVTRITSWQWYDDQPDSTTAGTLDADAATHAISGATSGSYTPKSGDVGDTLYVWVTYTDGEGSGQTATAPSANVVQDAGPNRAPSFAEALYERTVAENEDADSNAGAVITATDPDNDDTATPPGTPGTDILQYSLTGGDSEHFEVGNDGQITIVATFDRENPKDSNRDNVYSFTMVATDSSGARATTTVAVTVTNVDETLTIDAAIRSVKENASVGTNVGDPIKPDDDDMGDGTRLTYALAGTDAAFFNIHRTTGQITVKKAVNFEATAAGADQCGTPNACSVTVTATGTIPGGTDETSDATITINVTGVNEAPEYSQTATRHVVENTADDKVLGNPAVLNQDGTTAVAANDPVAATDADAGDRLLYTLGGPDAMYFDIYRATGQLITRKLLDYESLPTSDKTYDVTVTATDRAGLSDTVNVTIHVVDVDEPPVIIDGLRIDGPSGQNYDENGDTAVGTYEVQGLNAAMAQWTLEGADAGYFSLSSAMGMSTMLMFSSSPNFEMPRGMAMSDTNTNTYMVTVKASHGSGDEMVMDTQEVMVTVIDRDEDGMVTLSSMSPMVDSEITATLTDPDGMMGTTWQWSKSMTMDGTFMDIDGATSMTYTPVEADDGYYLMVKAMYTDAHGSQREMATTNMKVTSNQPPAFAMDSTTRMIAENTAAGMNIGDPVTAMDPDGDALTYSLSGTDAASFDIGMSTGQLMTKAALDYETKRSYMVTVTAMDPDGLTDTTAVTINVADVDENPLLTRFDTNGTPGIQRDEVIAAINRYLDQDEEVSRADVIAVIDLYLDSN